jgi:ABC-2 type transport system ATP-binding protein
MAIKIDSLSKKYGKQEVLKNISFDIQDNEIVGFIGPNGAGKTTTMKIICGLLPPTSGQVEINGLTISKNEFEHKKIIGYLPEHNPLYKNMYIKEYLAFVAGIYKIPEINKLIDEIIQKTGLTKEQNKKINELSKGYRQRVGLAQAMIHDPQILILDEPTTGLDPNQIIEIRNLIAETGKKKTIILSTHIMQEVEAICDRIIIINKGEIVANGTREEILDLVTSPIQEVIVEFDKEVDIEWIKTVANIHEVEKLENNKWLFIGNSDNDIRGEIFNFAVEKGLKVLTLQEKASNLEDIFHALTKK